MNFCIHTPQAPRDTLRSCEIGGPTQLHLQNGISRRLCFRRRTGTCTEIRYASRNTALRKWPCTISRHTMIGRMTPEPEACLLLELRPQRLNPRQVNSVCENLGF